MVKKLSPSELREHKGISFTGITVVFLCHDDLSRLFLTKRSKNTRDEHGRWDPGGGGLKHGQSVQENLLRELKEEYDVEPINTRFIGYYDAFRKTSDGDKTHWVAMCFAVHINPDQVRINEPDMVDDFGWFHLDNLPSPMHSQFGNFMKIHGDTLRIYMNDVQTTNNRSAAKS